MIDVDRPGSYQWWYLDATSDDGESALVAIFFVGSVFSPFYASRLTRGERPSPREHVAVNVALYPRGARRTWLFSEYSARALSASDARLRIGRSSLERAADGSVRIAVDDVRPISRRPVRGEIVLVPTSPPLVDAPIALGAAAHAWACPVPRGRVEARFDSPRFELQGTGYFDTNRGDEPPARALSSWSWRRAHEDDTTRVSFDLRARSGEETHIEIDERGVRHTARAPGRTRASLGGWLLPLPDGLHGRAIERAPFYARFAGRGAMAEHVDFARWETRVVQAMLHARLARRDA